MILSYEDISLSKVGNNLQLKTLKGDIIVFTLDAAKTLRNEIDSIFATERKIKLVKEQIQELNQQLIDLGYQS